MTVLGTGTGPVVGSPVVGGPVADGFVSARLGIRLQVTAGTPGGGRFADAVELGLRRNPNRAQLLVSRLLGKHIPVPVADVLSAAHQLGGCVRAVCGGRTPVVIGFAETATALGHGVAAVSAAGGGPASYLHTTRRPGPPGARVIRFCEEHSHAVDQSLAVLSDAVLTTDAPLVLVDDELTTGTTAVNAISALHRIWPRETYVLASLIDCRDERRRAEVERSVRALGATVLSVSLLEGRVRLPAGVLARAAELVSSLPGRGFPSATPHAVTGGQRPAAVPVSWLDCALPAGGPATGRHGWDADAERAAVGAMGSVATSLPVAGDARTLVLGDEELMYLPQLLAAALGREVRVSTTTRTPAVALDAPGYPLRTVLAYASTEDGRRPAFAYNVAPSEHADPGNAPGFDDIVLVTDARPASRAGPLAALLSRSAARGVHIVVLGQPADAVRPAGRS